MLWKVGNYNTLRRQQDTLKHNYEQLQSSVQDTNQRLDSLQSLATEVAMTYGFMRFRQSPFGLNEASLSSNTGFDQSVAQFNFLKRTPAPRRYRSEICSCSQRRVWVTLPRRRPCGP